MRPFLVAAVMFLVLPAAARAGTYDHHTLSPSSPGLDGWTPRVHAPRGFVAAGSAPGALVVRFWARPWFDPGDAGEWSYAAPADTTVAAWRFERAVTGVVGGDWNTVFGVVADGRWRYVAWDVPSVPRPWGRVAADGLGGDRLVARLQCGGPHPCFAPSSTALLLRASRVTLHDGHAPSVSRVHGQLAEERRLAGTAALSFAATDRGGGVYRAFVEVDGRPGAPVAVGDDRCRDLVPGGSPYEFSHRRPCSLEAGATVAVDTTRLSDGRHTVAVRVEDAAGNATPVYGPVTKVVDNVPDAAPRPSTPPRARLTAWLDRGARAVTTAYGRRVRLTGRVTDAAGRPLAAAPVDVAERLIDGEGRPLGPWWLGPPAWRDVTALRTLADGRFSTLLEADASRRLKIAGPAGSRTPSLTIRVRAPITIRARRHGTTVTIHGRLHGTRIPPGGALVELQVGRRAVPARRDRGIVTPGLRAPDHWTTALVVRTRPRGRFVGRLLWVSRDRVAVRARVSRQAGLPYAAGLARAVSLPRRGGRRGPSTSR